MKTKIKAPHQWPLWGKSTGNQQISRTKGQSPVPYIYKNILTDAHLLSMVPTGTRFSEIWIKMPKFLFKKVMQKCLLQNGSVLSFTMAHFLLSYTYTCMLYHIHIHTYAIIKSWLFQIYDSTVTLDNYTRLIETRKYTSKHQGKNSVCTNIFLFQLIKDMSSLGTDLIRSIPYIYYISLSHE